MAFPLTDNKGRLCDSGPCRSSRNLRQGKGVPLTPGLTPQAQLGYFSTSILKSAALTCLEEKRQTQDGCFQGLLGAVSYGGGLHLGGQTVYHPSELKLQFQEKQACCPGVSSNKPSQTWKTSPSCLDSATWWGTWLSRGTCPHRVRKIVCRSNLH